MDKTLTHLPVLVLDCQTTGPNPDKGHLLEIAWGRLTCPGDAAIQTRLIAQPEGAAIPDRIQRLTGIGPADLGAAVPADRAWSDLLADAADMGEPPWPVVIHYARFERPFLDHLHAEHGAAGDSPLRPICTHQIARRLLPGLPRRGLRAVAGYFGHHLEALKRAGEHAQATAFIWRELVDRLRTRRGVETLDDLETWLREEAPVRTTRKSFRLPRATRLGLPTGPGVYRMLGKDGQVLYAGKATSLKARVSSHFSSLKAAGEKNLELYSQVWDLDTTPTESALEAALLELDVIRELRPAYNSALLPADERVWYARPDLEGIRDRPDPHHRLGPLSSPDLIGPLRLLGVDTPFQCPAWWPDEEVAAQGAAEFWTRHGPPDDPLAAWLLRLGARLGRADPADPDDEEGDETEGSQEWDPTQVARMLEGQVTHLARLVRRSLWLTRLSEAELAYQTRSGVYRWLSIRGGSLTAAQAVPDLDTLAPPPAAAKERCERQAGFDRQTHDRLRVLTTELKRLVADDRPLALRLGAGPAMGAARLRRALDRF